MSLFARSYSRLTGSSTSSANLGGTSTSTSTDGAGMSLQNSAIQGSSNITTRRKLATVSTLASGGGSEAVQASPRNSYQRIGTSSVASTNSNPMQSRDTKSRASSTVKPGASKVPSVATSGEKKATTLKEQQKERERDHQLKLQQAIEEESKRKMARKERTEALAANIANPKPMKPRTSTSSLASAFRSRASSPIERVFRKIMPRSSSKSAVQSLDPQQISELRSNGLLGSPNEMTSVMQYTGGQHQRKDEDDVELDRIKGELRTARNELDVIRRREVQESRETQTSMMATSSVETWTDEIASAGKEKQYVDRSQQCSPEKLERNGRVNVTPSSTETVTLNVQSKSQPMTSSASSTPKTTRRVVVEETTKGDKENVNPNSQKPPIAPRQRDGIVDLASPEVICLDDSEYEEDDNKPNGAKETIEHLRRKLAEAEQGLAESEQKFENEMREHKAVYRDFLTVIRVAERRREEADKALKSMLASSDDEDWSHLMSQHRHVLRRNVLLMWAQKIIDSFNKGDDVDENHQIIVTNFSSDWSDCRAFCCLIQRFFPDLINSPNPLLADCVPLARSAFETLGIEFSETGLGIAPATFTKPIMSEDPNFVDASPMKITSTHPDWRYVMDTVFAIYKKGVIGKVCSSGQD